MANLDPKTSAGFGNLPFSPKIILGAESERYGEINYVYQAWLPMMVSKGNNYSLQSQKVCHTKQAMMLT